MGHLIVWIYKYTGWQLAAALAFYLGGWGVLSMPSPPLAMARFFVYVGCIWAGLVGAVWIFRTDEQIFVRVVAAVVLGLVVFFGLPETLRYITTREPTEPGSPRSESKNIEDTQSASPVTVQDTAIFMECTLVPLPLTVDPGKSLNVIPLIKKRMEANKWGFYDVAGSSEDGKWPRGKAMEESIKAKNLGVFAYRCRVTNRGPQTIIYLGVPIDMWFGTGGPEIKANRYTAILSGIGPKDVFEFYLVNDCNIAVTAIWQETATVQILGEANQRNVPLRRTFSTPIDQVMMLLGTSVRWIGGEPCE
jgi:hypothetical protein